MTIEPIAHIRSPFGEKFGIPRQSSLAARCPARIEFEPGFALEDAVRGLESFSHIWLIWGFSEAHWDGNFTVRPPRLGGNTRIGVFASRSPFRPNSLGMSAVKLERIEMTPDRGPVIHVLGADLLDGTPIYDIKPYIPYADCIPDARDGYTGGTKDHRLKVKFAPGVVPVSKPDSPAHGDGSAESPVSKPDALAHGDRSEGTPVSKPDAFAHEDRSEGPLVSEPNAPAHGVPIDRDTLTQIRQVIALDPRVSYDSDPDKVWGMSYGRWNIRFTVAGDVATIVEITES